jgi:hypothetical protein
VVGATDLNTQLRDNMAYVGTGRPGTVVKRDNGVNYSSSSTSFVDIDSTNLVLTVITVGGAVIVFFQGVFVGTGGGPDVHLDLILDGTTRYASAGADGSALGYIGSGNLPLTVPLTALYTGLSAGSHTFKVQWKASAAGTVALRSGNGTGGQDFIPIFWAREIG